MCVTVMLPTYIGGKKFMVLGVIDMGNIKERRACLKPIMFSSPYKRWIFLTSTFPVPINTTEPLVFAVHRGDEIKSNVSVNTPSPFFKL